MPRYYVRIGSLGEIHVATGHASFAPGTRVVVRTSRGVELGWVAAPIGQAGAGREPTADVLRGTTAEDELLLKRLERHKQKAVESCRIALRKSGSQATLLDVDQIFDGGTLLLHFLGPVDELAQAATAKIVQQYESVVRSRHIAKLLAHGCGPGCGTATSAGAGCGTGGCGQCGLACR